MGFWVAWGITGPTVDVGYSDAWDGLGEALPLAGRVATEEVDFCDAWGDIGATVEELFGCLGWLRRCH